MRSQLSRASLRKLQLQRLQRLARSGRPAQKEIAMLIRVVHPFASPDLTTGDIFTVDASDFMCWALEWKNNQAMFVSWASFLASCLADYRHQHEVLPVLPASSPEFIPY